MKFRLILADVIFLRQFRFSRNLRINLNTNIIGNHRINGSLFKNRMLLTNEKFTDQLINNFRSNLFILLMSLV